MHFLRIAAPRVRLEFENSVEETMNKMLIAALALAAAMTACTSPMTNTYKTTLAGTNEVPAVTTTGTGSATATLDINTKVLTVTGNYSALSGAVVTPGAHIHGPALAGTNAPVIFNLVFTESATAGTGTLSGTFTLTDAQITDLNDGKYYVNVHTAKNNGGEIRGQLTK
jgi:CHRD domain